MSFGSALLGHRRIFWIATAIGMVLALFSLRVGFALDDYAFLAWLDGVLPKRTTPFDLYEFATGDQASNFEMVRRGPWPWYTDLELKVRFFRPLSSALLWLDHRAFGHAALGYHVHSIVWYLLFLLGGGVLFSAVLSPRVFALAFLLFAITGTHSDSVGWISARHMLVGGTPVVWALVAHVYYRERGFRAGRWLAMAGMIVGLLGSEVALGGLLYWIAYEALAGAGQRGLRERAPRLAVPVGMAAVYFIGYKVAGYGAAHNDAYFEPLSDPLRFALAAVMRLPLLLGQAIGGTSSEFAVVTRMAPFTVAGALSLLAFAALLRAIWPYVAETDRRALPWLATGAVLATLIAVGGYPGGRLLLLPGIAGYALVATVILHIGDKLQETWLGALSRGVLRGARGYLVFFHCGIAPLMFLANTEIYKNMGKSAEIDEALDPVLGSTEPPSGQPAQVVILAASDPVSGIYVGAARAMRAPKTTAGWTILSMAKGTHHVERTGPRTLVISADPGLLYGSYEVVFRGADYPMHVGDRFDLDPFSVKVLSIQGHYPTSFEVDFRAASLDDPSLILLIWRDEKLEQVRLAIGGPIDVPWTPGPTGFF
jgi:hypothetical protein